RQGLGAHVHRERIGDGDGQRQTDPKAGSASSLGLDLDLTAEAADVLTHDVHPDTAACLRRHRGRRAESGKENEIADVALAHPRERLGRDEAAAPRRFTDGLHVDAPAVVGYLDVDRPALVSGAEADRALGRLVLTETFLFGLDAVGDGVPHQMDQRVGHQLHDRGVHLDGLALDLQRDALAGVPRAVTDHSHEGREETADRHHAGASDLVAQRAAQPLHAASVLADDPDQPGHLVLDLREVVRYLAHPAGKEVEVVVAVELELVEGAPESGHARRGRAAAARSDRRHQAIGVLRLELDDGLRHARLRERQKLAGLLELDQMALQTAPRDHQLADQVHESVEPIEADTNARTHSPGRGVARLPAPRCATRSRLGRRRDGLDGLDRLQVLRGLLDGYLTWRAGARHDRRAGRLLELRLDARRQLDHRRSDWRQCVEPRGRTLIGGDTRVGTLLGAPHEQAQRIEAREDGLDRPAIQRALLLADLSEHILDPMREVADHPAADRVRGALERVDRAEQRRQFRLARAFAFQRDQRLRHRLEM